jgi:hypothetical protein
MLRIGDSTRQESEWFCEHWPGVCEMCPFSPAVRTAQTPRMQVAATAMLMTAWLHEASIDTLSLPRHVTEEQP